MEELPYTKENLKELKAWFDAQELPKTMQINQSCYTDDLPVTIGYLFEQAELYCENHRMMGSFVMLQRIKQKLQSVSDT